MPAFKSEGLRTAIAIRRERKVMIVRTLLRMLVLTVTLCVIPVTLYADTIDWSHRWELTPLEHKRMRAMGLNDVEVFTIANIQQFSAVDPDFLIQGIFRGVTLQQAAGRLGMPTALMLARRPEWGTPAWEQAVKEGRPFFSMPPGSMPPAPMPPAK